MSSREIAELTGKRHDNVRADIEKVASELSLTFQEKVEAPTGGRPSKVYFLPKRETLILCSGYSVELRARIIDRWMELEAAQPSIPNFSDPAAAARAWASEYEARQIAERTKAEIGSRREATAMNTASQAVKKANRLEIELDRSRDYATVKRMSLLYHGQQFEWRMLKHVSQELGIPPIDVFDANYGSVKGYHADVWREAYALEIQ
ncbi:Rha family transcriptional regulator [Rhizobium setariae]|nr:Rha family transcriptional regulator [Rhizobium setariae]